LGDVSRVKGSPSSVFVLHLLFLVIRAVSLSLSLSALRQKEQEEIYSIEISRNGDEVSRKRRGSIEWREGKEVQV
jgi:hypothetical protein